MKTLPLKALSVEQLENGFVARFYPVKVVCDGETNVEDVVEAQYLFTNKSALIRAVRNFLDDKEIISPKKKIDEVKTETEASETSAS